MQERFWKNLLNSKMWCLPAVSGKNSPGIAPSTPSTPIKQKGKVGSMEA